MLSVEFSPASTGYMHAYVMRDGKLVKEFSREKYDNYHDYFKAVSSYYDQLLEKENKNA